MGDGTDAGGRGHHDEMVLACPSQDETSMVSTRLTLLGSLERDPTCERSARARGDAGGLVLRQVQTTEEGRYRVIGYLRPGVMRDYLT